MSFGLVLSGGSVRGLAHIGVLKVLNSYDIPIDLIVGTSMGGAIGGLVSAGIDVREVEEFVLGLPSIRIVEFGYGSRSILSGNKIYAKLLQFLEEKGLGHLQIEETKIPFKAVAVDLMSGEEYVFDHGDLDVALRATTAIPGVFAPVTLANGVMVDGGLLNNLPTDVARASGIDQIVAVDVAKQSVLKEPKSMVDVLQRSFNILLEENTKHNQLLADLLLKPHVGQYAAWDLKKIQACIKAGERETEAHMKQICALAEGKTLISTKKANLS